MHDPNHLPGVPERCAWAQHSPLEMAYHDREWGVPTHDDQQLFTMLTLEGAQAGLSWSTILKKRAGYLRAFADFDIPTVAAYQEDDIQRLLVNAEIVRHQGKIRATVQNARACLAVQREQGSFAALLWQFVSNQPQHHIWQTLDALPSHTLESDAMSKALKQHGFAFVGTTICYAFMQATGMVNDHLQSCFRWNEVRALTAP